MLLFIHVSVLSLTSSNVLLFGEEGLMKDVNLLICLIIPCGKMPMCNVLFMISEWCMACRSLKYALVW